MTSRRWLAVVLFCVAVAAVRWVAADNDVPEADNTVAELSKRVQALEARLDALERRTIEISPLAQAVPAMQMAPVYVPGAVQPQPQVPSNWTPHQFNGMTYYILPLANGAAR